MTYQLFSYNDDCKGSYDSKESAIDAAVRLAQTSVFNPSFRIVAPESKKLSIVVRKADDYYGNIIIQLENDDRPFSTLRPGDQFGCVETTEVVTYLKIESVQDKNAVRLRDGVLVFVPEDATVERIVYAQD